jgi:hypothetical protein
MTTAPRPRKFQPGSRAYVATVRQVVRSVLQVEAPRTNAGAQHWRMRAARKGRP